jgi:very-short-patch-repair endonuclease
MAAKVSGWEVDALFPDEKVIVELDGWDFHSSRESFESDRERDASTLAAGCVTVRVTWERMHERAAREAARLQTILEQQRGQAA